MNKIVEENEAASGKRPFLVFTNLRDAAFVAPVRSKHASKSIKQKKRPQQNKLHFSTEVFFFFF